MSGSNKLIEFSIYRYNPENNTEPFFQKFILDGSKVHAVMVLDALLEFRKADESLSFRRSCREGVCGSDGMNINGKNTLACITPILSLRQPIVIKPFPGMPIIRDLIVDMDNFFKNYEKAEPYLQNDEPLDIPGERLQTQEQRAKLDGLYECILCGCCSSACPSYWWNPDKFMGPAALLQASRFIQDSRDTKTVERLQKIDDAYSVFRCRSIMNCVSSCPKGLNPTKAIAEIRDKMVENLLCEKK